MIDRVKFEENFRYFDKQMIAEVIELFINEQPLRFENLQKNIAEKDYEGLAFNLHSLKSVLSNFMAPVPFELAKSLEEMAKSSTEKGLPELFSELRIATQDMVRELDEIRKGLRS
jgi:HPt (histidine-containing phosphotransfer) domain-containing protein